MQFGIVPNAHIVSIMIDIHPHLDAAGFGMKRTREHTAGPFDDRPMYPLLLNQNYVSSCCSTGATDAFHSACVCHEEIGGRDYQEDRHLCTQLPSSLRPGYSGSGPLLLAVYDGHGGSQVSQFLANKSAGFIAQELANSPRDLIAAIQRAFVALDAAAVREASSSQLKLETGGSTAVVVLCSDNEIICANCGDSRAVLARSGCEAIALSEDHKPDREDEEARIFKAGGRVLYYQGGARVMGVLAMSRAIGDPCLQRFGVTPVPEVKILHRSPKDEFLILASDGLWGVVSNQDAVDITRCCLLKATSKGRSRTAALRIAAKVLSQTAAKRGNRDNITVVLADLQQGQHQPDQHGPKQGAGDSWPERTASEDTAQKVDALYLNTPPLSPPNIASITPPVSPGTNTLPSTPQDAHGITSNLQL